MSYVTSQEPQRTANQRPALSSAHYVLQLFTSFFPLVHIFLLENKLYGFFLSHLIYFTLDFTYITLSSQNFNNYTLFICLLIQYESLTNSSIMPYHYPFTIPISSLPLPLPCFIFLLFSECFHTYMPLRTLFFWKCSNATGTLFILVRSYLPDSICIFTVSWLNTILV